MMMKFPNIRRSIIVHFIGNLPLVSLGRTTDHILPLGDNPFGKIGRSDSIRIQPDVDFSVRAEGFPFRAGIKR